MFLYKKYPFKQYCFYVSTIIFVLLSLQSCKDDLPKEDKTMSGNFRYFGNNYNIAQADFRSKKYNVINPAYGQAGQPLMIDVDGIEINLWSHPVGKGVLLNFQITGNTQTIYNKSFSKPIGFNLNMFEEGNVYKRSIIGNSDSAWVDITKINLADSLVSGKFYTFDKRLVSGNSDYYAITQGEFKNVKMK